MASNKPDLKHLEGQLQELQKELHTVAGRTGHQATASAAADSGWDLWLAIHRPGYTTPKDIAFAAKLVDSMLVQARALESAKQAMLQHVEDSTT
jgi:hypothetical protein